MNAEDGVFVIGVIIGVIVASIVIVSVDNGKLNDCAEKNNIYECEWVTVPIESNP